MTSIDFFIKQAKKSHNIIEFLRKELQFAGFSHADIKKTPLGTRITIYAVRPGLVIGSGGDNIKALTEKIKSVFNVENPHIEVEQVDDPYLDPHIVGWRIARALEKGTHFKRISNIMITRMIQSGARGVEIRLSGKLPSKRAKTWKFNAGNLRKCGQEAVEESKVGYEVALKKQGIIGVRVALIPPHVKFSDEIRELVIEEEVEDNSGKKQVKEEKVEVKPKEETEKEIETVEKGEAIPEAPAEEKAEETLKEAPVKEKAEEAPAETKEVKKPVEEKEEGEK